MNRIINHPNEAPIDELYVFLSYDEKGNEGVCAHVFPDIGSTPLVTSKERIADMLKKVAQEITDGTGMTVKLVKFKRTETIWETELLQKQQK